MTVILKKKVSTFSPGEILHRSLSELFNISLLSCAEIVFLHRISAMLNIAQGSDKVLTYGILWQNILISELRTFTYLPSHHLCK